MPKKKSSKDEAYAMMAGKGGSRTSPYSKKDKKVKGSKKSVVTEGGMVKGKKNRDDYLKSI